MTAYPVTLISQCRAGDCVALLAMIFQDSEDVPGDYRDLNPIGRGNAVRDVIHALADLGADSI